MNVSVHFTYVERAINRIKTYRILRSTLKINTLNHADDSVRTFAALCNLKSLGINLIKT